MVEYSATYNGFPVVFSIYAGNGEHVTAILKSLEVLENIQCSFIYASTDTPHVYFHLIHGDRSPLILENEAADYAKQRGQNCLSATGIILYPSSRWSKNILWVLSVSGATVKGLHGKSIAMALKLIDEKVSAAQHNSLVIDQQWEGSKIMFGGCGRG